ncbi:bifunctional acetate--CoA ligase family protein/GNAT family N-acetyltransferase [Halodesulfovibrio sp.]|uniref:bifunctional acetate--CoA ligase family protein/GNAT family N-acetyltransferase n=1 Tax=Halodesulfovibrio sp. TaxID=1912772 RepID=UPI0025BBC9B5|nr:bifunctional acetate--CoA ligase family protein/GNAT family N-acetyltransferase [Halodesulfovibrio sp.]
MSRSTLKQMFRPTSVVIIGASEEAGTPACDCMQNLLGGTFLGPVLPVVTQPDSPETIFGQPVYTAIDTLPITPDLAIICVDAELVPFYIEELGKRGTQNAILFSQGYSRFNTKEAARKRERLLALAHKFSVRLLGPNGLGFINPSLGINASLVSSPFSTGKVAFLTQSDSLFTSVLDWAVSKSLGFSHVISLGDMLDVGFSEVLDYLHRDMNTRAVLLYLESVANAREFMSAARALSRSKPVIVVKAGKSHAAEQAVAAHTGMILGADEVYEAAFKRAGMLRMDSIDSVFDTIQALAWSKPLKGKRLAIVANGGAPAFIATDLLLKGGGELAELTDEACQLVDDALGSAWSYWNPLVMDAKADPDMYANAIRPLLRDSSVDGILIMHIPTAGVDSAAIAEKVVKTCKRSKKVILTSWLGAGDGDIARNIFFKAKIPSYFTPDSAVRTFLYLVQYRRNQIKLAEAPESRPDSKTDVLKSRAIVLQALEEKRQMLTVQETEALLAAYDIKCITTRSADSVEEVAAIADEVGYPLAIKVISSDIYRKSQVGGVVLDIESSVEATAAAESILMNVAQYQPAARIHGFAVQKMTQRMRGVELAVEIDTDPQFGPVIRFGQGGSLAHIIQDQQTELLPLNMSLAKELVASTHVSKQFVGNDALAGVNTQAVYELLVSISQMLIDIPEIFELEINPVQADANGAFAVDAAIRVAWTDVGGADQLAICPYPAELEELVTVGDDLTVRLRPIRPEDEKAHWDFIENLSPQDRRFRFFGNVGELPRSEMVKLTQIDYDREMAFIAQTIPEGEEEPLTVGAARAMISPDNETSEFAVVVRSDWKRKGLGRMLMAHLVEYLRGRNTKQITGEALGDNKNMVELARSLGFIVSKDFNDDTYHFTLDLREEDPSSDDVL